MKKVRGNFGREIMKGILRSGLFVVACESPNFVPKILPKIAKLVSRKMNKEKKRGTFERDIYNAFDYLRRKGLLKVEWRKKQVYIYLTLKGKSLAEKYQINDLQIKKTKKWDRLWRIVVIDISEKQKAKREALRAKIKDLGLYQLRKSVWVCPYNFFSEMELLREFFGLNRDEMKIIIAYEIENDKEIKKHFRLI